MPKEPENQPVNPATTALAMAGFVASALIESAAAYPTTTAAPTTVDPEINDKMKTIDISAPVLGAISVGIFFICCAGLRTFSHNRGRLQAQPEERDGDGRADREIPPTYEEALAAGADPNNAEQSSADGRTPHRTSTSHRVVERSL